MRNLEIDRAICDSIGPVSQRSFSSANDWWWYAPSPSPPNGEHLYQPGIKRKWIISQDVFSLWLALRGRKTEFGDIVSRLVEEIMFSFATIWQTPRGSWLSNPSSILHRGISRLGQHPLIESMANQNFLDLRNGIESISGGIKLSPETKPLSTSARPSSEASAGWVTFLSPPFGLPS